MFIIYIQFEGSTKVFVKEFYLFFEETDDYKISPIVEDLLDILLKKKVSDSSLMNPGCMNLHECLDTATSVPVTDNHFACNM